MPPFAQRINVASELARELVAAEFGPFYATECGFLSSLHRALDERTGVLTVAREDNAVGIAVGASLTGRHPVVLMENAGLGASLGAIASLVVPYRIPLLFVVDVRTVPQGPGATEHIGPNTDGDYESAILRRLTAPLLLGLKVETFDLDPAAGFEAQCDRIREVVQDQHRPAALLIGDDLSEARS